MLTTTEKALHPQSTLRMQLHKKNLRHAIKSLMERAYSSLSDLKCNATPHPDGTDRIKT